MSCDKAARPFPQYILKQKVKFRPRLMYRTYHRYPRKDTESRNASEHSLLFQTSVSGINWSNWSQTECVQYPLSCMIVSEYIWRILRTIPHQLYNPAVDKECENIKNHVFKEIYESKALKLCKFRFVEDPQTELYLGSVLPMHVLFSGQLRILWWAGYTHNEVAAHGGRADTLASILGKIRWERW